MWRVRARGRRVRHHGVPNKTEAAYAQHLKLLQQAGEVEWYAYEAVKLRLAPKTFLTVDFFLMLANGDLEAHEVKGFMEEDARVKLKVAAALYPFTFKLVRLVDRAWNITEVGGE
jgi:hypothetical protein